MNFIEIVDNICSTPMVKENDSFLCECVEGDKCAESCLNRATQIECDEEKCPNKKECTNTRIQNHKHSKLQVFTTTNKGLGIRTIEAVPKNAFMIEYVGEIVTEAEFQNRLATKYCNTEHFYAVRLKNGLVIDAHDMGNCSRYINQSCVPIWHCREWQYLQ